MLRELLSDFTHCEQDELCRLAGTSWNTISVKYLRSDPANRAKPRSPRFEELLTAINTVRPGSITREQLAAYFYAAPVAGGEDVDHVA